MAGSRLEKIGTIFSRTAGLLRSGAMRYQDRPVWYDIYRVFPPKYEPYVERQPIISPEDIPDILYKDDKVRAKFFQHYGLNPGGKPRKLNSPTFEDASQEFLVKYLEIESHNPNWSFEKTFEAVAETFHYQPAPKDKPSRRRGREDFPGRRVWAPREDFRDEIQEEEEMREEGGRRKVPLITAESLRSLFEEAKNKQDGDELGKDNKSSDIKTKD